MGCKEEGSLTQQQMVQQKGAAKKQQAHKPFPWKRTIIMLVIGFVLMVVYILPVFMNSLPFLKGFSSTLIPLLGAIAAFIVALIPVIQLVFPPDPAAQPVASAGASAGGQVANAVVQAGAIGGPAAN